MRFVCYFTISNSGMFLSLPDSSRYSATPISLWDMGDKSSIEGKPKVELPVEGAQKITFSPDGLR